MGQKKYAKQGLLESTAWKKWIFPKQEPKEYPVCSCGRKYVPTQRSKKKCLFCFWNKK